MLIFKNTSNYRLQFASIWSKKVLLANCDYFDSAFLILYKVNQTYYSAIVKGCLIDKQTTDSKLVFYKGTCSYSDTESLRILEIKEDLDFELTFIYKDDDHSIIDELGCDWDKYDLVVMLANSRFKFVYCCLDTKKALTGQSFFEMKMHSKFKHEDKSYRVSCIKEFNGGCRRLNPNHQNEIYHLVNFRKPKTGYSKYEVKLVFDVETINMEDGRLYPFMIVSCLFDFYLKNPYILNKCELPPFEYYDNANHHNEFWVCKNMEWRSNTEKISIAFVDYLKTLFQCIILDYYKDFDYKQNRKTHFESMEYPVLRIFGFNNFRFDDYFFMNNLLKLPGIHTILQSRNGKTTLYLLGYHFKTQHKHVGYLRIIIDDLIRYIPDVSLKKASNDYKISQPKIDFDILKYINKCNERREVVRYANEQEMIEYMGELDADLNRFKTDKGWLLCDEQAKGIVEYYCDRDVMATMELFKKVVYNCLKLNNTLLFDHDLILKNNIYDYISIAQLAFCIFQETARKNKFRFLKVHDRKHNEFIHASCFGGRVNYGFIGEYTSDTNLKYMDVTSEYPLAMTAPYPSCNTIDPIFGDDVNVDEINESIIKCQEHLKVHPGDYHIFDILPLGIFLADLTPPEHLKIVWAPFAIRDPINKKNRYANAKCKSKSINTINIRLCILMGWDIKILPYKYNTQFMEKDYIFLDFIDIMGIMKTRATTENKSFAKLIKAILNSPQGKLAMKPQQTYGRFETRQGDNEEPDLIEDSKYTVLEWDKSFHYLSSFVTAYANWILMSTALKLVNNGKSVHDNAGILCYCDTDSIIFDGARAEKVDFKISNEIGRWNTDRFDFDSTWTNEADGIKSVIIIARKSYALLDKDKNIIDLKLKGIHKKQASQFDYERLKICISERFYTLYFNHLQRARLGDLYSILKRIEQVQIKKTLNLEQDFNRIIPTIVSIVNQDNFNQVQDIFYKHYLEFCCH